MMMMMLMMGEEEQEEEEEEDDDDDDDDDGDDGEHNDEHKQLRSRAQGKNRSFQMVVSVESPRTSIWQQQPYIVGGRSQAIANHDSVVGAPVLSKVDLPLQLSVNDLQATAGPQRDL
ncbi:hypothetical protein MY11210_004700 [Beauveria gryllotalpidicola]